ncbi:hypothetical protein [Kineosporia succinea]|uniref:Uncharacterized protein n=1 Tax=Kineosporia succinea TaxID=84632 RepID=A0ABT9P6T2_9ACTN|nr:hypothetical protein [Kineosporia succinea]MDP9828415.1 hypothetical protein [Kineosporia succinea]
MPFDLSRRSLLLGTAGVPLLSALPFAASSAAASTRHTVCSCAVWGASAAAGGARCPAGSTPAHRFSASFAPS